MSTEIDGVIPEAKAPVEPLRLLAEDADFLLMNAYAARVSGAAMSGLLAQALDGRAGVIFPLIGGRARLVIGPPGKGWYDDAW